MHVLSQRSYTSDGILSVYDLILIPKGILFVGLMKQSKSNMVEKGQP